MIPAKDLRLIARARLRDAKVLLEANRSDSAIYLCGYAVELALKARICRTLKWPGFPETSAEFKGLQSFKTHDLAVLLSLSGIDLRVKARYGIEWNGVVGWNPEDRYRPAGQTERHEAAYMVKCAKRLLDVL
jgi:HEPN domain-containing protein